MIERIVWNYLLSGIAWIFLTYIQDCESKAHLYWWNQSIGMVATFRCFDAWDLGIDIDYSKWNNSNFFTDECKLHASELLWTNK